MENKYTIAETFTLPSHAIIYKDVSPEVKLRSMTVRDEMQRMNPSNDGALYKNLAMVIDNCMIEKPGISSYDMCIGDFQFLMHKLRTITYGPMYKMECRCPYCSESNFYEISLDDLKLFELDKDFDSDKYLKIELPVSKKKIELQFNTPRILDQIEKDVQKINREYREQNKVMIDSDWHLFYQLFHSIKNVDGVPLNYSQKETFVGNLVGKDFNYIINKLNRFDDKIGIGNLLDIKCLNCGGIFKASFRLTTEFFKPTVLSEE